MAHVPGSALNHLSDFEQLDDYSLMGIFDYLDVHDLVKVAQMNPRFTNIVLNQYIKTKFRVHDEPIIMKLTSQYFHLYFDSFKRGRIHITAGVNQSLWVLEHFGRSFNNLRYDIFNFGTPNSQKFFEIVEKNCPRVDKPITIEDINHKAMANWTFSFDNTTTSVKLGLFVSDPLPLRSLFPYMQELNMISILKSAAEHFPHLTKCSIKSSPNFDDTAFELFRLNPQLRHLHTMTNFNSSFVNHLNEMVPNLESLSLDVAFSITVAEMVRFKNVKEFTLDLKIYARQRTIGQAIDNIRFDQLKKLKISTDLTPFYDNLIDMIVENSGLWELEANLNFVRGEMISLLLALPELEKISLYWYTKARSSTLDSLEQLFASDHRLNQITVCQCDRASANALAELNPLNWQLVAFEDQHRTDVSFIRKNF